MNIDLSKVDTFDDDKLILEKKITFIFGKNGTGKSTLTNELKKLSSSFDVYTFQGFHDVIDDNQKLNAVVLGEENVSISREIEDKRTIIEKKQIEVENINKNLQQPEDDNISNYRSRKDKAERDFRSLEKKINEFYANSASKIKHMVNPSVAGSSYNKRDFQNDISGAVLITQDELEQYSLTIKSEVKVAPCIKFPQNDFQGLVEEVNIILQKSVTEQIMIPRLDNNANKREFAENGFHIHKKGEICAFCGNKIKDATFDELKRYFSADEVKSFQNEVKSKIDELTQLVLQINNLEIDNNNFYPEFCNKAKEIEQKLENKKKKIISNLNILKNELNDKLKSLFNENSKLTINLDNFDDIKECYDKLLNENNKNDLMTKQNEAKDKIRKHYVKKELNDFGYENKQVEINFLKNNKTQCDSDYDKENKKKIDILNYIYSIKKEIINLQNETKSELLLATNINKKLKHMSSFELVHVEDKELKGFYEVKNSITNQVRKITELSTGEKNVIAFLYFIEKLNEIKDKPSKNHRIIVFDDPMSSNDDGMQYLIIDELDYLMKNKLLKTDQLILLTHNKHFYLNVKYNYKYNENTFIRFQNDGNKTHLEYINKADQDFKTSYESLWFELKTLFEMDTASADLLLNPIRRIIETFTKFNALSKKDFCSQVSGALKLFNVNSHSIDDIEAELNGKTKINILQIFYDCFKQNNQTEHFEKFWRDLIIDEKGIIVNKKMDQYK